MVPYSAFHELWRSLTDTLQDWNILHGPTQMRQCDARAPHPCYFKCTGVRACSAKVSYCIVNVRPLTSRLPVGRDFPPLRPAGF